MKCVAGDGHLGTHLWRDDSFRSLEAGAVAHYFGTAATLAVGAIVCALAAFVTLIIVRRRDAQLAAAG
jgi:hypothetical protein